MKCHAGMSAYVNDKLNSLASLLEMINVIDVNNNNEVEKLLDQFKTDIDVFQEGPHLLDPKIPYFIDKLVQIVLTYRHSSKRHLDLAFQCAYLLTKTRGFKIIVNHLPHEVKDVPIVMELLLKEDALDTSNWETKYMLLLWLSVLVLIPIDLKRFDADGSSLLDEIYSIVKTYLTSSYAKDQDIASFLAAKFLTRPEVFRNYFSDYIDWSLPKISALQTTDKDNCQFSAIAILASFHYIFKIAKREIIRPYAERIMSTVGEDNIMKHPNDKVVLYAIKTVQRIGLSLLPVREAVWRYKRCHVIVVPNVAGDTPDIVNPSQDCDFDVPENLEGIIDVMLKGVRHQRTRIRWSSAKGIGRICSRLPKELAEVVTESILNLFSFGESDNAWHGGCLSLAELGRRGLILPHLLPMVFKVLKEAIVYDEFKGCFSVGSHVRDAACYVCWSFARSYDPHILKPFVDDLAVCLLTVAVFDREVNCRRAGAAAFQENVGRQGALPDGIEIVTVIDYNSVASRRNCFVQLAPFLAKFEVYQKPLIEHLLSRKINHWDKEIRLLAAESLALFCRLVPEELIFTKVIPELMSMNLTRDLNSRHGSVCALGRLLVTLSERHLVAPTDLDVHVKNLINEYQNRKYLDGFGSELTKESCCYLLKYVASAHFHVHSDDQLITSWTHVIVDAILNCRKNNDLLSQALDSLPVFCLEYISVREDRKDTLFNQLSEKLSSSDESVRSWVFESFRSLPITAIGESNHRVLVNILVKTICRESQETEAKSSAIKCLSSHLQNLPPDTLSSLYEKQFLKDVVIRQCFINGTKDYTTGSKGDIGLVVRWNSIQALGVSIASCV